MQQERYWQDKVSIYLHDPINKCFKIQDHEKRAKAITDLLYQTFLNNDIKKYADAIASGLTRANLPQYNSDESQNGAINIINNITVTHPIVKDNISIPFNNIDIDKMQKEIENLLTQDLKLKDDFETFIKNKDIDFLKFKDKEEWSKTLFFYLFFALKNRLRQENVSNIGALWDILPADTRMPDHSIWSHCALTSAISSSMSSDSNKEISLSVFSITPVQAFISNTLLNYRQN